MPHKPKPTKDGHHYAWYDPRSGGPLGEIFFGGNPPEPKITGSTPVLGGIKNPGGAAGAAIVGAWKSLIIDPAIGDFKKNRGKVVIGIMAGIVLIGSGVKIINGMSGGNLPDLARSAVAPETEGLSVIGSHILGGAHRRLHAREPLRPVRAAMKRAG